MIDERESYEPVSANDVKIMLCTAVLTWVLVISGIVCLVLGVLSEY